MHMAAVEPPYKNTVDQELYHTVIILIESEVWPI